jgi:hypothetical protein
MITHIVFFRLRERNRENIDRAAAVLSSMAGKIPQLRHLEVGTDIIRSDRSYDIALVTKFDSLEDLQAYQIHPYHAGEVAPYVRSVSESVAAVDYEA